MSSFSYKNKHKLCSYISFSLASFPPNCIFSKAIQADVINDPHHNDPTHQLTNAYGVLLMSIHQRLCRVHSMSQ